MFKSKKVLILIAIMFIIGFATTSVYNLVAQASVEEEITNSIKKIQKQIELEIQNHTTLALSSNPYDYVNNIKEVENIVDLGYRALPYIEQNIDESEGSGLMDYILAIAAEKIAKVDLKKNSKTFWDTGNAFSQQWKKQLQQTPQEVNNIANSNLSVDEKIKSLETLGIPAIPFIIESVKEGNNELFPAIPLILGEESTIQSSQPADEAAWMKNNETKFEDLKAYVLSK